jgi:hypothetical protein
VTDDLRCARCGVPVIESEEHHGRVWMDDSGFYIAVDGHRHGPEGTEET